MPLVWYALLMVGTPGPANLLAMAAGANYGFYACLPFMAGLVLGKLVLASVMALGLLALLKVQPLLADILRVFSTLYILWLAWRIAGLRLGQGQVARRECPRFFAGMAVHPLNPKAWAMLTAAFVQFTQPHSADQLAQNALVVLTFFVIPALVHPLWCYGGVRLMQTVGGTVWERVTMRGLALSLIAVLCWTWLGR